MSNEHLCNDAFIPSVCACLCECESLKTIYRVSCLFHIVEPRKTNIIWFDVRHIFFFASWTNDYIFVYFQGLYFRLCCLSLLLRILLWSLYCVVSRLWYLKLAWFLFILEKNTLDCCWCLESAKNITKKKCAVDVKSNKTRQLNYW